MTGYLVLLALNSSYFFRISSNVHLAILHCLMDLYNSLYNIGYIDSKKLCQATLYSYFEWSLISIQFIEALKNL